MRRSWLVVTLICFVFSGSAVAFGDEQKMDKETYQTQAEKTLKVLEQNMEQMKDRASDLKMESKEKFDQEMEVLKKKKEAADKELEKLKSATGEAWEKAKAETEKAMKELTAQYDKMMSRFNKP